MDSRNVARKASLLVVSVLVLLAACSEDRVDITPTATKAINTLDTGEGSVGFCDQLAGKASVDQIANDIAPFQTVFSTDFVTAGVGGMRNIGNAVINVAGISGTVTQAILYWHGPTNSADPNANANVMVNGNAVSGTNIGLSNDNCWGYANSQGYRADVTALVQVTGNGAYNLSGFGSAFVNTNGASMVVFFNDGDNTNNRDVVMFDGNDSNISNVYDADGWNVQLAGINYTSGSAFIELHVADGQTFQDDDVVLNASTLLAGPQVFDGNTVPSANNGPTGNGSLWDIRSADITSYLSPGPNALTLTTGEVSDCLSLVVALIDLPAGAAPGQPVFLDIKPTSCPNPFNVKAKGVLPVAILGTDAFDVADIDPSSVRLEGVAPLRWQLEDVTTPVVDPADCNCTEDGPDGIVDLTLKFDRQAILAAISPIPPDTEQMQLTITGELVDGTVFEASDCIWFRGEPKVPELDVLE